MRPRKFYETGTNYTYFVYHKLPEDTTKLYPVLVFETGMRTRWWELRALDDFDDTSRFLIRKPSWWPKADITP